jgi:competence protein ComEA
MTNSQLPILRTASRLVLVALVAQICVIGAGAAQQSSSKPTRYAAQTTSRVDVNSADLETLETLPGVGAATAKKIVAGRPFSSLSDLENVKGLSKAKVDKLKDKVTFGATAPSESAPSSKSSHAKSKNTSSANSGAASSEGSGTVTGAGSERAAKTGSASAGSVEKLAPGQQLNINTASASELEKIPGIGPTKAQAIVDYRTQNGNFKSIEDIEKVKGIKSGVFSKAKDYIKVNN